MSDNQKYNSLLKLQIGQFVDKAKDHRGISLDQLATDAGISKWTLKQVILGKNNSLNALIAVFRVLDIHLELAPIDEDNNIFSLQGIAPSTS